MDMSLDDILNVENGGHPIHEQRKDGSMKREIQRILDRNKRRTHHKSAGHKIIAKDLKDRHIVACDKTV